MSNLILIDCKRGRTSIGRKSNIARIRENPLHKTTWSDRYVTSKRFMEQHGNCSTNAEPCLRYDVFSQDMPLSVTPTTTEPFCWGCLRFRCDVVARCNVSSSVLNATICHWSHYRKFRALSEKRTLFMEHLPNTFGDGQAEIPFR